MIASARMYAVAAPVARAWQALFTRVAEVAGVDMAYVEHAAPAPVSALWARPDGACVFMCGYPYACAPAGRELLAAPVPSAPRYQGRPIYFSEFIVRAGSAAQTLPQTFGGRLACMLPESNSGYNAPRHFLMRQAPAGTRSLYRPTAQPTPTPLATIDAVIDGAADVGVVDSYVLDLLRGYAPERMAQLKTLAHTPGAPIPPLVASAGVGVDTCTRLREALLALDRDAVGAALMAQLGLARFAAVQPEDYACLTALARESDDAAFALTMEEAAA
ncbi:hypothetical protein LMG31506_03456 [Cupriavidus yeoncheonensis]|uniref:Uncharacterized protein n=1 Tax=Cupriavidus yeoncheonensis TaxID=1462994 RepID=A0A916N4K2_9BURK|nr:PhnD/SsuA/transferrin family substrate-binding protein [Cupriavidus yeoncheonensis]CAG2146771.1 hypothetical protein LMG31506_03456 [Cupriavidus yeoncheonensis]